MITKILQKRDTITKHMKTPAMIFELRTCNRTCHLKNKLKACLQYTKQIKAIRNHKEILGKDTKAPILCFKGGKNLGSILVKATLHQTTNNDKT